MQKLIECPVCFDIYDTKVRVPKTLSCGHSFCAPCLCNISSGSSINCPTCRSHTSSPRGEVNQLPTNYAKIECLQSTCEECKDQLWTGRCVHCSQNLCDKCRSSHPTSSAAAFQTSISEGHTSNPSQSGISCVSLPKVSIKPATVQNAPSTENESVPDYKNSTHTMVCGSTGKGNREFDRPWGIATSKSSHMIAVTDLRNNRIQILNKQLNFVSTFGKQGSGNAEFNTPWDIAISNDERIFITDGHNHCVKVRDRHGRFLYTFGCKGTEMGQFLWPTGIAQDGDLCYVCDSVNHRVQVMKTTGVFVQAFGSEGSAPGRFESRPWFICVAQKCRLIISDSGGNLHWFTTRGQHLKTIKAKQPPQNINAAGIVIDDYDNIIVADASAKCLVVMNPKGDVICRITHSELGKLRGVACTENGDILVCDVDHNKIRLFSVPKI